MTEFERIKLYLDEVGKQNNRASNKILNETKNFKDIEYTILSSFYVGNGLKKIYKTYPELDDSMGAELDGSEEKRVRFEELAWLIKEGMRAESEEKFEIATKIYEELLAKAGLGYFKLEAQAGLYRCKNGKQTPQESLGQASFYINRSLSYLRESIRILELMEEQKEQTKLCEEIKKELATAAFYGMQAKRKLGIADLDDDLSDEIKNTFERFFSDLKKACELESTGKLEDAQKFYTQILTSNLAYFTLRAQAGLYRCGAAAETQI